MKAIVLLGVPGAGKGTVAEFVAQHTTYRQLSTGVILRESMRDGTELGHRVESYIEKGRLVPDSIVLNVVRDRLAKDPGQVDYMFDGFPRTEQQARLFDELLRSDYGTEVQCVFYLDLSGEQVIRRLTGRLCCRLCGAVYHRSHKKPLVEGVCDKCGGEVATRDDDTEVTIRERLRVFEQQTSGLVAYYEKQRKLIRVDASGLPETVAREVMRDLTRVCNGAEPV